MQYIVCTTYCMAPALTRPLFPSASIIGLKIEIFAIFQSIAINIREQFDLTQWVEITDKETDESWDMFIICKINSGLVRTAGQYCEKKVLGRL